MGFHCSCSHSGIFVRHECAARKCRTKMLQQSKFWLLKYFRAARSCRTKMLKESIQYISIRFQSSCSHSGIFVLHLGIPDSEFPALTSRSITLRHFRAARKCLSVNRQITTSGIFVRHFHAALSCGTFVRHENAWVWTATVKSHWKPNI